MLKKQTLLNIMSTNEITKLFGQTLEKADTEPALQEFRNTKTDTNIVRVVYMLLSFRRYSFIDPESKETVSGVTFTLTDGSNIQGDESARGISILSFSITDKSIYNSFGQLPIPPLPIFADIRIGKKSSLKAIYTFEQVLEASKPLVAPKTEEDR